MPKPPPFLPSGPAPKPTNLPTLPDSIGKTVVTLPTLDAAATKNVAPILAMGVYSFGIQNLGASSTLVQLYEVFDDTAHLGQQLGVVPPFRGSIIGMAVKANATLSAGSVQFVVFKNGATTNASMTWSSSNKTYTSFPQAQYGFVAGDEIDIRATTDSSYSPTTNDLKVWLYLALDTSTSL